MVEGALNLFESYSLSPYPTQVFEFVLKDSHISLTNGARVVLWNTNVELANNNFVGNGTIEVKVGDVKLSSTRILTNVG